jgi:molybdopterin-guanine dinucleotide biosynthesis protein A
MGQDKATLPFGPELMLQRVVRLLSDVIDPRSIVVVAALQQQLPPLPPEVIVTRDHHEGRGPLEGLSAGLQAIPFDVQAAYVTGCDVPLLVPAFVTRIFERLGDFEIAVPVEGERLHPLAGVYRSSVKQTADRLLAEDRLRLQDLFDQTRTRRISVDELRDVDPQLHTLINLNRPEDYQAALAAAGMATMN